MPEWFDPILNTSLATGLVGFVCWGIVKASRFFGPKVTAIAEGHVATMAGLTENSKQQTALIGRQVEMVDSILATQGNQGQKLERIEERVEIIHGIVTRRK